MASYRRDRSRNAIVLRHLILGQSPDPPARSSQSFRSARQQLNPLMGERFRLRRTTIPSTLFV